MNDQLSTKQDIFVSLEQARVFGDRRLVLNIEQKITAAILMSIREELRKNPNAGEILNSPEAETLLFDLFKEKVGADDFLTPCIKIILQEYEIQKNDPGLYIIDNQTGRAIIKSDSSTIFQPQDVVLEDGTIHKPGPIVHPKISSSLGLLKYQKERKENLQFKALDEIKNNPSVRHAYDHILNPDIILEKAKFLLEKHGVQFEKLSSDFTEEIIELGKENAESDYQGMNLQFHRANMLGSILAKRILDKYGKSIICNLVEISELSNSKFRWFEVIFRLKNAGFPCV
jgi:hypothetical protein